MLRFYLLFGLSLLSVFALPAQVEVHFPAEPELYEVPAAWRGHNLAATANLSWLQHPEFQAVLEQLPSGVIRWPFGNQANNYDWQAGLAFDDQFNLKNAAEFTRQTGMELQMVVNFGNGSAQQAADFVRFCNSTDPSWAQQRQQLLGDSQPLGIRFWEIGNEVTTAWGFAWSWLGYQPQIRFRSGEPPRQLAQHVADSLYFYGGSFWREGWVTMIGGLNKKTAILGDLKLINAPLTEVEVEVEFPKLDTSDPNAVRVWLTPNVDFAWAESAPQQELYDSITQPWNLLPPQHFSWTETAVHIAPPGGIPASSALLIEYNSIGHDGAFAFAEAMKAADPSIQVGFSTRVKPPLSERPQFQQDFAAHAPHFMIEHPYFTSLTQPLVESGRFSEMAYVPEFKRQNFLSEQEKWDARLTDWNLPHPVGVAFTEWNVGLCDACPNPHPFDGIAGAMYVASFWANLLEAAVAQDLDIRTINHFALYAGGNNFIHLFHINGGNFSIGNEGYAALLLMEAIGKQMVGNLQVSNMPQILLDDGQGNTFSVDALEIWGGYDPPTDAYKLLLLNRDDEQARAVRLLLPSEWEVDSLAFQGMTGTLIDDGLEFYDTLLMPQKEGVELLLPRFSISVLSFRRTLSTSTRDALQGAGGGWRVEGVRRLPDHLALTLHAEHSLPLTLTLTDVLGRVHWRADQTLSPGENQLRIPAGDFSGQMLLLHLRGAHGAQTLKIF